MVVYDMLNMILNSVLPVRRCQLLSTLAIIVSLVACSQDSKTTVDSPEQKEVKEAFKSFKLSLTETNPDLTLEVITDKSISEFGLYKEYALYSSEDEVRNMSPLNKMYVLALRHLLTAEELNEMDSSDVLRFLMENGIALGGQAILYFELGYIAVVENTANAAVTYKGKSAGEMTLLFQRQSGKWKLDIIPFMKVGNPAIKTIAEQNKISEDDFILLSLETLGTKPSPNVWQPLISKK